MFQKTVLSFFLAIGTKKKERLRTIPLINKASLTFLERHKKNQLKKNEKDAWKFNDNETSLQIKRVCEDIERIAVDQKQKNRKIHKEPQSFAEYLRLTLVFMWNSALPEKFDFCFSRDFAVINKILILAMGLGTGLSLYGV